jgi:hypothetical protein
MADCYILVNEASVPINSAEFLNNLSDYKLLREGSTTSPTIMLEQVVFKMEAIVIKLSYFYFENKFTTAKI